MNVLSANDINLHRSGRSVLKSAGITLAKGELLALVGPNGSGKSSLLRVLAGLLPPERGQVSILGRPLSEIPRAERATMLGYLPQETQIYWDYTVEDLIELGRGRSFWRRSTALPPELVQEFELAPLAGRALNHLSGGERARVLLAAAVARSPQLLLADEPLASLDVCHQMSLMERLRALRDRCATVIVLHDLNLAARYADRVVVMSGGRTVLAGPTAEVMADPCLDEIFRVRFARRQMANSLQLTPETAWQWREQGQAELA